jgi:hypothetical protein
MPKTEAWRVCGVCDAPMCRHHSKDDTKELYLRHRETCGKGSGAGFPVRQLPQGTKAKH